ncbi:hypothetical protein RB595_010654 [Gaeumannomyces hyphopodioides]
MNRNDRQRAAPPSSSATPQQPPPTTRNNEYFLPRDGIDREVITADICRYLGNDALVRPGHLEKGDRIIQGYYITAYRNLTSAMIESLKEDSQKWVEEKRRAQGAQGGQMKYMDSMLRNPASGGAQHIPAPSRDFPAPQPPYNDPYGAPAQGGFGQYPPRDAGYPAPNAFPPREPYDDRQDPYGPPRGNPGQYAPAGYQAPEGPYMATGMNFGQGAQQQYMGDHQRAAQGQYPPTTQAGGYVAQPAGYYMGHAGAPPPPAGAPYDAAGAQSRDVFHGRGSTGFSNPGLDQQYEHPDPSHSRASATPTAPSAETQQVANSGNQPARRDHNRPEQRYSNTTRR